ncbi:hypothetical protein C8R44DRAFT_726451 [Mycena epipterygia]|nr:hypothetical protein C8R44DRAFT_744722 [Mycena epipterygia]KAJ7140728.1 hypothetical protein C8R44DRAFT_726451 [Mycena epipterygia]
MAPLTAARRAQNLKTSTSSSKLLQISRPKRNAAGRTVGGTRTLTQKQARLLKQADEAREAERRSGLTDAQRAELDALQHDHPPDIPEDDGDAAYEDNVLRGNTAADISHAGEAMTEEEVEDADQTLLERLHSQHKFVVFFLC